MNPEISVIICTHDPRPDYLAQVLSALEQQTLAVNRWELILVDNASPIPLTNAGLTWHPTARVVREEHLGLTAARVRGFVESNAPILVFVDDDNVLDSNYLSEVATIFAERDEIGAISGKSSPRFETEPQDWVQDFYQVLALRDFGDQSLMHPGVFGTVSQQMYPEFAPAGIGLAIRRPAFMAYVQRVIRDARSSSLGRTGTQLTSGEDNDIILTILNAGWGVGYFPQLHLTHLIPARRLKRDYLGRLNRATCRSWIQVLDLHGIRVWQKIPANTVQLRKIKAFFTYQAWRSAADYIRWQGACGTYEGLAGLS